MRCMIPKSAPRLLLLSILPFISIACARNTAHSAAAAATMQARNKALVSAFYEEVFNHHNVAAAPNFMAEDY